MNSEHGTKLLRETLRLSAAIADPTAYPVGARVQMHSLNNTRVYRGWIIEPRRETPFNKRRVRWDDDIISTAPVDRLELIEE